MCDAVSVGLGLNLLGAGTQALGQFEEGQYRQKLGKVNAQLAEEAAGDATIRGQQQAGQARMEASADIGEMRAAYGASGVDGSVGSPINAMADVRLVSETDAAIIRNNAAREAWGYRVEATRATEEGRLAGERGRYQAAGTLLGGAGDFVAGYSRLSSRRR